MIRLILYTLLLLSIGVCIGYIGGLKRGDKCIQEILNIINSDETEGERVNERKS